MKKKINKLHIAHFSNCIYYWFFKMFFPISNTPLIFKRERKNIFEKFENQTRTFLWRQCVWTWRLANIMLATYYILNLKLNFKNVSIIARNAFQTDFSITVFCIYNSYHRSGAYYWLFLCNRIVISDIRPSQSVNFSPKKSKLGTIIDKKRQNL